MFTNSHVGPGIIYASIQFYEDDRFPPSINLPNSKHSGPTTIAEKEYAEDQLINIEDINYILNSSVLLNGVLQVHANINPTATVGPSLWFHRGEEPNEVFAPRKGPLYSRGLVAGTRLRSRATKPMATVPTQAARPDARERAQEGAWPVGTLRPAAASSRQQGPNQTPSQRRLHAKAIHP